MDKIDYKKIRKVRELEYSLTGSHTDKMYEKESHCLRKKIIEDLLLKYKKCFYKGNVLDYGCAEGIYCKFMRDHGFQKVSGCDISSLKIEGAKKKFKKENIIFFDLDSFDNRIEYKLIICLEVLQHIPDYADTLISLRNVLCNGGYLLISIPNLSRKEEHEFADINDKMTAEELLHQIGGAGFGRQNAIWKFNSALFYKEVQKYFDIVELIDVDTPDGLVKKLWTVGLLRKN